MKSAKVVNKILLISLAFGSVTFVAGMLAKDENIQKALVGAGAAGSIAGLSGALVTNSKNKSDNNRENELSDSRISEMRKEEAQLQKSFDDATVKMQAVEADINSLQVEHNQLLSIISDLNSQKLQLEQVISPIEESFSDISVDDQTKSSSEIPTELELGGEQLVNSLDTSELEASAEAIEKTNEITENIEEDINPFASGSELSESIVDENDSDLAMVDKLIGTFDESELEMFEQKSSVKDEYSMNEESDSELEEKDLYEEKIEHLINSEETGEIESESEDAIAELSLESEPAIMSESDDFVGEWAEESETAEVLEFESEAESEPFGELISESESVEELSLDGISEQESKSEDAIAELSLESESVEELSLDSISELDNNSEELSLMEMPLAESESEEFEKVFGFEEISTVESQSDGFIEDSNHDYQSTEEFSLEEASATDSEFNDLMEIFVEDESNSDSATSDFQLEDAGEDLDELSSLDSVDQKLDELTKMSDESLGELNDLLDSVQENELEEELKFDEMFQDS